MAVPNPDLTTAINAFKNAIYGEEVRDALVDVVTAVKNAINNQLIDVDTTLTQSGQGADAKTVGDKAFLIRGFLANGSNLNDVFTAGSYSLYKEYTYTNCPVDGANARLLVFRGRVGADHEVVQLVAQNTSLYIRTSFQNTSGVTTWRDWARVAEEKTSLWFRGAITFNETNPLAIDLDDYKDVGIWHIVGSAVTQPGYLLHYPEGVTEGGYLVVLNLDGYAVARQILITWSGKIMTRAKLSAAGAWGAWVPFYPQLIKEYSSASTYSVGDICGYNGAAYRCKVAITTPETWDSAHWTSTYLSNELGQALVGLSTYVTSSTVSDITGGSNSCDDFPQNTIITVSTSSFELLNAPPSGQVGTYITFAANKAGGYAFVQLHVNNTDMDYRYKLESGWKDWHTVADTSYVEASIEQNNWAVDELGGVFPSQNELYLYHKSIEECPEYKYHFGDYVNKMWGPATMSPTNGWSNANHPIPYDDSLVLECDPGSFTNNSLYVFWGKMVDGEFEPRKFTLEVNESNSPYSTWLSNGVPKYYIMLNCVVRRYVDSPSDLDDSYIVVGATSAGYNDGVLDHFSMKRSNPNTKLIGVHLPVSLLNGYVDRFISDENSPKRCVYYTEKNISSPILLPRSTKYLYAEGLPIDAKFYDKNYVLIQDSVGDMETYDITADIPSCIKVPEEAEYYRIAVYGRRAVIERGVRDLYASILEDLPKVQAYVRAIHAPIPSRDIGQAIYNANKLMNFTYEAAQVPTRYLILNAANGKELDGSDIYRSRARGFVYGKRTPNIYISYYTYLTMYRFRSGYSASTAAPRSSNSFYGFVCISFISACLGFDFLEGTEWWLQNYASKLEAINRNTVLNVGDLVVMQTYYNYSEKPSLYTHIQLVTDVLSDPDSGDFIGYKTAECSNIWTRDITKLNTGFTGRLPSTGDTVPQEGVKHERSWRISVPITQIPKVDKHYRFAIDRELDTLNHGLDIEMPPCVCWSGDMCLIGPHPSEWSQSNPYTYIYVNEKYSHIKVYRNEAFVTTLTKAESDYAIVSGCDRYDLAEWLTTPGVYEVYCSEDGITYEPKPGTFYLPEYPECTLSNNSKTVTVSGVTAVTDESGKVISVSTNSFDEIWARVMPYPVESIDGFVGGPLYANYIYVNGIELWDGEKFDVGDRYQYIIALTFINDTFGAVDRQFSADYTPIITETEESIGDDDKDDPIDDSYT